MPSAKQILTIVAVIAIYNFAKSRIPALNVLP